MTDKTFQAGLTELCQQTFGSGSEILHLRRLSGGANMESWSLDYGAHALVLRRLPGGIQSAEMGDNLGAISLAAQADLITAAHRAGVAAPAVLARLLPRHGLGEGFLMARVQGETLPHKILGKPEFARAEANLTRQCARELARIHALDPAQTTPELRHSSPLQLVAEQEQRYRHLQALLPIYDFAFGWLKRNAPAPVAPSVLHGDFRMGNLMIDPDGITAVLDWELAHLGDPAQDLAYLCTPSWRFGHYDKPVGGFAQIGALLAAYKLESGRDIEPERLRYWLIFSTLWWGLVCLSMGQLWRSGTDRSLERTIIGRRVSEVEIDLLLLFAEEFALGDKPRLAWQQPPESTYAGETAYAELATALGEWSKISVQASTQGHQLFEARVAGNALGILKRQAQWSARFDAAAATRHAALGLDKTALCAALYNNDIELGTDQLWNHLRLSALERIAIDQPGYAGLKQAMRQWCE